LRDLKSRVSEHLIERKRVWAYLLVSLSKRTREQFRCLLTQKGFEGDLIFDHDHKRLEISVRPSAKSANKDTTSLSGGEKSFSTVSLLMSIWNVMETPLCAMDEFDIFMDMSVRKKSIELLINLGLEENQSSCQFLFLSPGDKKQVPTFGRQEGDIKVFEMQPPDRHQGQLPVANGAHGADDSE